MRRNGSRKTEVAQLQFATPGVDQQIFGLDVPMHHAMMMTPVNRSAQLMNIPGEGGGGSRWFGGSTFIFHIV